MILIVVVVVPPVATLIVGAAVVTDAVGATVSTSERGEARIRGDGVPGQILDRARQAHRVRALGAGVPLAPTAR